MEMSPESLETHGFNVSRHSRSWSLQTVLKPSESRPLSNDQIFSPCWFQQRFLNPSSNDFFWNVHLSIGSRLERVGGCPHNLSSSWQRQQGSLVCTKSFPVLDLPILTLVGRWIFFQEIIFWLIRDQYWWNVDDDTPSLQRWCFAWMCLCIRWVGWYIQHVRTFCDLWWTTSFRCLRWVKRGEYRFVSCLSRIRWTSVRPFHPRMTNDSLFFLYYSG
jgi:hypothetical protein